ncbi:MAG: hypothetical protein V1765_03325 [bacterium]
MPESRAREFKKPFILVAILLLVILFFIFNRVRTNTNISIIDQASEVDVTNRFTGQAIDQAVLQDQKFKELKPIPKLQLDALGPNISDEELAKVQRRRSNPFKSF